MNKEKVWKWLKTALMAAVGGGIAACIAALFDPAKFSLAKDLGSGKEWTFFLQGFAVTFGALLIKSPFGQEMIATYQKSQKALAESQGRCSKRKALSRKGPKMEMPSIVIPPHQKSKPREHWADREIKKAAEEIDSGDWIPPGDPDVDDAMKSLRIALGAGTDGVAIGQPATEKDFQDTEMFNLIGRHPRVVEALEKMKREVYDAPDPQAAFERNMAMRELATASTRPQHWDGQGRWEGAENEK